MCEEHMSFDQTDKVFEPWESDLPLSLKFIKCKMGTIINFC